MIGAYINGQYKPVRTELKNGDVVKILTSPQAKPSKDWINIITSSKAKQKVRQYFRNIELQEMVAEGKEIFAKRIRKLPVKIKSEEEILALARQLRYNDTKTFFAKLGSGELSFDDVKQVLLPDEIKIEEVKVEEQENGKLITGGIVLENIDNLMIRFAKCCNPQPGDEIVGYTTRGKGFTIHKKNCTNKGFTDLWRKEPERIMLVHWKREKIDEEKK
jgi:GTP pyrophosphokinase